MMKKILIVSFLCLPMHVYTQGWSFEYSLGYGTYKLDDVKAMQDMMLKFNGFGLKETDRFPGYITHSIALGYSTGYHHFGSNISYLTTGGRLHRADYSGSYLVNTIINGYRLGTFYRYYINTESASFRIHFQISSGVLFSNLKMKEKVHIFYHSAEESNTLKSTGMYMEPTIGVTYHFLDWLYFSLGGGYEVDFSGTLKFSGQETQMKAHWNGLRLYGSLLLILPTK